MWPLYLKINELPYKLRNYFSNKILAGVWFGAEKPVINTFLKPLCTAMTSLFKEGIIVNPPEIPHPITCKAIILSGTCDLPAKACALNMVNHNGFSACPYCEQTGKTFTIGNGHVHIYPYQQSDPDGPKRDTLRVKQCSMNSAQSNERVMGINPPVSCLLTLPLYNVVKGCGIDYMHCVLLDVVRLLMQLWFDSTHHSQPWSCSRLVSLANQRL